jgi:4'-phosphopantetheinyl transferase
MKTRNAVAAQIIRDGKQVPCFFGCASLEDAERVSQDPRSILHPGEAALFRSFKYEKKKQSYLMGRIAAKIALSAFLREVNPARIEIVSGVFNQPLVRHASHDVPEVSISHTGDRAVAVCFPAGHCIGIDLETVGADPDGTVRSQLTSRELSASGSGLLGERLTCLMIWSMKEALSKALKCGLTIPLEILEIDGLVFDGEAACSCGFRNFGRFKGRVDVAAGCIFTLVRPGDSEIIMR